MPSKKPVKKPVKPKAVSPSPVTLKAIAAKETKTQIMTALTEETGLTKKQLSSVFVALAHRVFRHMKKNGSGIFTIPEVGVCIKRKIRPASKERDGRNPATGKPIRIPAKPAKKVVRINPLSVLKKSVSE